MKEFLPELKSDVFSRAFDQQMVLSDPVDWIESNLGYNLVSIQIDIVECIFNNKTVGDFNVLASRGDGKTYGAAFGLIALACLRPKIGIIVSAPILPQAIRIIRYMTNFLTGSKAEGLVDWGGSGKTHLRFMNGSFAIALSGQENANIEGEHGHVLYIDEAHLMPSYSVTNKLTPMLANNDGWTKTIKTGVSMGKGHFYKSCTAKGAITLIHRWMDSEIFLNEKPPFFYKGKQYSKRLIARMPLSYKKKYFPDRPDLWEVTGSEGSDFDWKTQYEMEWVDDVNNFLSDEDQIKLVSGNYPLLTKGYSGEFYVAGLDTAPGSKTGKIKTDRTVLCIWKVKNGVKTRVASYIWKGNVLKQEREIFSIINPVDGLFKVQACFADWSNIATTIVDRFKEAGVNITGVLFGSTAREAGSAKNWKNTMFDHFEIELQSDKLSYPSIKDLKVKYIDASGAEKTQIENCIQGFNEWCSIQRIRGRGLNDEIQAPKGVVDEDDTFGENTMHDDCCSADVLAVYAADHIDIVSRMGSTKGDLSTYQIPTAAVGGTVSGNMVSGSNSSMMKGALGQNPVSRMQYQANKESESVKGSNFSKGSNSLISGSVSANRKR
jgi:hypothetical protein